MTPLTHKEASDVVNALEYGVPEKSSIHKDHFKKAEEMGLITQDHDKYYTKYVVTEKAHPLIKN